MYRIEYYKKKNGDIPCREFIDSLSVKIPTRHLREAKKYKKDFEKGIGGIADE